MNSDNTNRPVLERAPGTQIYNQLTSTDTIPVELTPAVAGTAEEVAVPASHTAVELAVGAVVRKLFGRIKKLEASDGGWNGGDTIEALDAWFAEFGIDVDADEMAAAQALHVPAWLARALTALSLDEPSLIIYLRTNRDQSLKTARAHLTALVGDSGAETSVAVFDITDGQIAHIVHPGADPAGS